MKFSLETRQPFLDYRLVEKTLASNMDMIIKNGYSKSILRESMIGYLPEEIRKRKSKVGFETPQEFWFRKESFSKYLKEIIYDQKVITRNIVNLEIIKKIIDNHLHRKKMLHAISGKS